ncbi:MAG: hypothetical protein M4579_006994 [Chaenotheca gracillima]|nr:MAG: hypothetical protein M4579_006994 [Chaenotheca gracillima]
MGSAQHEPIHYHSHGQPSQWSDFAAPTPSPDALGYAPTHHGVLSPRAARIARASARNRIGHACDPCRRRKTKCDGTRPACARCRDFGMGCFYVDGKRERLKRDTEVLSAKVCMYETVLQELLRDSVVPTQQAAIRRVLIEVRSSGEVLHALRSDQRLTQQQASRLDGILSAQLDAEMRAARQPSIEKDTTSAVKNASTSPKIDHLIQHDPPAVHPAG